MKNYCLWKTYLLRLYKPQYWVLLHLKSKVVFGEYILKENNKTNNTKFTEPHKSCKSSKETQT